MRRPHLLLPVLALLACGESPTAEERITELRIAAAEARWEAHRPPAYSMIQVRGCYCLEETIGPVRIDVYHGSETLPPVGSMTYVDTGEPVPDAYRRYFLTVEQLFAFVRSAIDRDAHRLRVELHEQWGFPEEISVDFTADAVDDEIGYFVTNFAVGPVPQ